MEMLTWKRAAGNDGWEAADAGCDAYVYQLDGGSKNHPTWKWAVYRDKAKLADGFCWKARDAKRTAETNLNRICAQ